MNFKLNVGDRIQYAKVIASACLMVAASIGLCFYSAGVFYDPLARGLNISLGKANLSTTFMLIFMALTTLAVPRILKKIQLYNVMLIGTIVSACSVLGIAFSLNVYFMYFFSALLGCGNALIGMVPATTLINNWFEKGKSRTTSIVLAGSALSAAIFSPLMSAAISTYGWRLGVVIQGVLIVALMAAPIYWHCPLHPAAAGQVPYGTDDVPTERKKTSYLVIGCFALIAILSATLVGLTVHFSPIASSLGLSALTGAVAISWAMIGNLVFKLLGGWLSSRLKPILATGILDIVALCATIGLWMATMFNGQSTLLVLAFFYGSVFALNELSLPLLVSARVSRRRYSSIYAILNFLSTFTTALAISGIGFLYDNVGTYTWIYGIATAEEVIILGLIWYLIHDEKIEDLVSDEGTRAVLNKLRTAQHSAQESHKAAKEKAATRQGMKETTDEAKQDTISSIKQKFSKNSQTKEAPVSTPSSVPPLPAEETSDSSTPSTSSTDSTNSTTSSEDYPALKEEVIAFDKPDDLSSKQAQDSSEEVELVSDFSSEPNDESELLTTTISPMTGSTQVSSQEKDQDDHMDDLLASYLGQPSKKNSDSSTVEVDTTKEDQKKS